jgi:hypothetical protein
MRTPSFTDRPQATQAGRLRQVLAEHSLSFRRFIEAFDFIARGAAAGDPPPDSEIDSQRVPGFIH